MDITKVITTVIICMTVIALTILLTVTYINRNRANDIISVTGLGKIDFTSDLIVWSGRFSRKNMDLKRVYNQLNQDKSTIERYLIDKGVQKENIIFSSIDINNEFSYYYDKNDRRHEEFTGYRLTQQVQIESKKVNTIENISREITELINAGLKFDSRKPDYYYTKLAELKIEMIAAATKDARMRAEKIALNSGVEIGKLKYSQMGVFQIIAQNSNEDYTWGGAYNTSSKNKTATITMKLQFGIK